MSRLVAVLLLVAVAAGCGVTHTWPFSYGEAPDSRSHETQVFLRLDNRPFPVLRPGSVDTTLAERLDLLFAGPTDDERRAGLDSSLSAGARLVAPSVTRGDGSLVLELDGVDLAGFGRTEGVQVACTVTPGDFVMGNPTRRVVVRDTSGGERGPFGCE